MCHVSPEHIGMLRLFGTVFFVGGIVSILTGVTYCRGVIRHDEGPITFWLTVIGILLLGGGVLVATWVCA